MNNFGLIRHDEAYSKSIVLQRLGISQKFWDKMLDDGLPYTDSRAEAAPEPRPKGNWSLPTAAKLLKKKMCSRQECA